VSIYIFVPKKTRRSNLAPKQSMIGQFLC